MDGLTVPEELVLIAGNGVYPLLLAESARRQGVRRLTVVAFRSETDAAVEQWADATHWIRLGQLGRFLEVFRGIGTRRAVMAGQITPTHLFRVRPDAAMLRLLRHLKTRNAETIFGAVADELRKLDVELLPASSFMEPHMPYPGLLSARPPSRQEAVDIQLGLTVAKTVSGLDIGQTVIVKEGTILAVEAFEGTDATIVRAGRLGGRGAVVVKASKPGHDMRFDIPVVGRRTLKRLRRIRAAVLAVEARRTILLEREALIAQANAMNLCFTAVPPDYAAPPSGEAST